MGHFSSSSGNSGVRSDRIQELDALRGLAAMGVVLFHYTYDQPGIDPGFIFTYGITGVDLFFMISGFTISLSLNKTDHWKDFIVYRFGRLYPAFWTCVLITSAFLCVYDFQHFNIIDILVNMTMVPAYFGVEDLDGSYWTLAIEFTFYFWILCVYMTGKINSIEIFGALTLAAVLVFHFFGPVYPSVYKTAVMKIQLINHFSLFFSGILFYQLRSKGLNLKLVMLLMASILSSIYLHNKGGRSMYLISGKEHCMLILFYHIVFAMLSGWKLRFLSGKPFVFLGTISFCLYLLHQYIGRKIVHFLVMSIHMNIYVAILLVVLYCIFLAYIVTRFVEIPANRFIRTGYKKMLGVPGFRSPQ